VADDGTHANAIENSWSLWSRSVMGAFHHVSPKHLHRYLTELSVRHSARKEDTEVVFEQILSQADGRRFTMAMLVGSTKDAEHDKN
jgi:hypothetical protein